MTSYRTHDALINHKKFCQDNEAVNNTFPKKDYFTYNKWYYKNKVPFTIYCDCEAYNESVDPTKSALQSEDLTEFA